MLSGFNVKGFKLGPQGKRGGWQYNSVGSLSGFYIFLDADGACYESSDVAFRGVLRLIFLVRFSVWLFQWVVSSGKS